MLTSKYPNPEFIGPEADLWSKMCLNILEHHVVGAGGHIMRDFDPPTFQPEAMSLVRPPIEPNQLILVEFVRGDQVARFLCDKATESFKRLPPGIMFVRDRGQQHAVRNGYGGFVEFGLDFYPVYKQGTIIKVVTNMGHEKCDVFINNRCIITDLAIGQYVDGTTFYSINGTGRVT